MYLIKSVETYRADSEAEAKRAIEEAKNDGRFELIKYEATKKEKKAKGEVVDEWTRVVLHKAFNIEAEPTATVNIDYQVQQGVFPEPIEEDNGYEGDF
jgi:hypothetical protein